MRWLHRFLDYRQQVVRQRRHVYLLTMLQAVALGLNPLIVATGEQIAAWSMLIVALVIDLPSAFVQQLLLLGIFFRITEQALGTWWALLITVLVFGLVHLIGIPHITVVDILGILLAGLLFATTYLLTRRLWLPIGLHIASQVTLDGIFGVGVAGTSGVALKGVLLANLTGPALLTGGASGAQASLVTIVVTLAASSHLIVRVKQKGEVVKPSWKRERPKAQVPLPAN